MRKLHFILLFMTFVCLKIKNDPKNKNRKKKSRGQVKTPKIFEKKNSRQLRQFGTSLLEKIWDWFRGIKTDASNSQRQSSLTLDG